VPPTGQNPATRALGHPPILWSTAMGSWSHGVVKPDIAPLTMHGAACQQDGMIGGRVSKVCRVDSGAYSASDLLFCHYLPTRTWDGELVSSPFTQDVIMSQLHSRTESPFSLYASSPSRLGSNVGIAIYEGSLAQISTGGVGLRACWLA
jgi:hypothetical protein